MDSKRIGMFISERRKDLGLTQQQLAEQLGISNKAVSKWETGEGYPDITIILDLSKTLSVTADELLNGEMFQRSNSQKLNEINKRQANIQNTTDVANGNRNVKPFRLSIVCIITGMLISVFLFTLDGSMTRFEEIKSVIVFVMALVMMVGGLFLEVSYVKRRGML